MTHTQKKKYTTMKHTQRKIKINFQFIDIDKFGFFYVDKLVLFYINEC